ncbi:glycosyltransferase [Actinomadura parmotrematis]|uniref:glycosyltransferase n=1 Tax=Actinomadura parmotrematis TaxID=2864039 RepID=UPI00215D6864|nr:glycosyltransferase [Actinomadura parmotrematis]
MPPSLDPPHEHRPAPPRPAAGHRVTAVLVAHDGVRWLPDTLKALLTQARPPDALVAADTGSRDRGAAVLAEVVGADAVLALPRTTGYGEAIAEALRHPAAARAPADPGAGPATEWIWLLHDDSAPDRHALAALLRAADADPRAAVLGPKLRDWYDRGVLLEVGVAVDGATRRETGLDGREFDQGQRDGDRDVLAVSSAGMLVRRDVWDRLGGFDVEFGLFRDDLDLCWRAHAAGHRVMVVTGAVVYHAEASRRGLRTIGMTSESPRRRDRRNALYALLGNLPLRRLPRALLRNGWAALMRALVLFAVKQPGAARDELAAFAAVAGRPGRFRRVRADRADGRKQVYRTVRRFQPRGVALRRLYETVADRLAPSDEERDRERDAAPVPEGPGPLRRLLARPAVPLVVALCAVTPAAERSLPFAGGRLGGGALAPPVAGASDLWHQYLAGWHPAGLGSAAGSPPWVGVVALLSSLTLGKPWLAVALLLLGSVPLAGLAAYRASRLLLPRAAYPLRVWFAATYALLPTATGAIAGGRLGSAVVVVLLPLVAVQAARMLDPSAERRKAGRAAWATGLLLAVAFAFVPLTWLLAVLGGGAAWALAGRPGGRVRRGLVIALGVPPLLCLPWTLGLLAHPSRFLLEAGLNAPYAPATAAELLTLNPGGPGTPPYWATAGLPVAAFGALWLRGGRRVALAGWLLAVSALLVALLTAAITVTRGPDPAPAWPGAVLLVAAAGLLAAVAVAVRRAVRATRRTRPFAWAVLAAAVATPILAAGSWILDGAGGPLGRVDPDTVPGYLAGPAGPRTLALRAEPDGRISYSVLRGAAPVLGDAETPADDRARHRMDGLAAAMAVNRPGDDGTALARMGVQYLLVNDPRRSPLTAVLDATPELSRLSRTATFAVWRVQPDAGRRMLDTSGALVPLPASGPVRVPPGPPGRILLLAEPADGGWHATLDGRDVPSLTVDGWAQGYRIPPAGGVFDQRRGMLLRHGWLWIQGAAALAVLVLALPGAQLDTFSAPRRRAGGRRRRTGETAAVRAEHEEVPA